MAKKRKAVNSKSTLTASAKSNYDFEERFDNSEDDFYAGRDKILLDEEPATKRRRRIVEQEKDLQPSDEEVLGNAEDDDEFEDAQSINNADGAVDEEDDEIHWGTTKADYYNTDVIETEADALEEEQEAERLQQKQLDNMTNADFGFDEAAWSQPEHKARSAPVIEKLPEARIPASASKKNLVDILYDRYPEFGLLAKDLVELQTLWTQLQNEVSVSSGPESVKQIRLNALTSYLGSIAMYFALITSTIDLKADKDRITALPPNRLREHAIIDNLMASRQLWDAVKDIQERDTQRARAGVDEVAGLEKAVRKSEPEATSKPKSKKQQEIQQQSPDIDDIEMPDPPVKSRRTKAKIDLQSLLAQSAVPTSTTLDDHDFGDEAPLTHQEAQEKARKKKSLRFYTSQIVQKANKRGAASRDAGGDDDVPHKERLRDKQERLLKEAEKRGQQKATADEKLNDESEPEDLDVDNNEYYESLVADSKRKKAAKKAKADAYTEAARQGAQVFEEEQVGPDGKRRITYAIEKNKGLTPKRKKDVRNPRVKKRKKFDEKMKKLGSVRQVYKGGEGRGGYGGELTGIKTNIVKSVKL